MLEEEKIARSRSLRFTAIAGVMLAVLPIPALAVIESDGQLVVSLKNGEFENARATTPQGFRVSQ